MLHDVAVSHEVKKYCYDKLEYLLGIQSHDFIVTLLRCIGVVIRLIGLDVKLCEMLIR